MKRPKTMAASDGKHYWNCWTSNYRPESDGYIIHAFCEEDKTGRALCGCRCQNGGGVSFPSEGRPSCFRCQRSMEFRGVLNPTHPHA